MKSAGDAYDRLALRNPLGFWAQRVCSVENPALDDALKHVGHVWAGMDVVLDYVASPPATATFPKTLVISCTNDFGVDSSLEWKKSVLNVGVVDVEEVCLETC